MSLDELQQFSDIIGADVFEVLTLKARWRPATISAAPPRIRSAPPPSAPATPWRAWPDGDEMKVVTRTPCDDRPGALARAAARRVHSTCPDSEATTPPSNATTLPASRRRRTNDAAPSSRR